MNKLYKRKNFELQNQLTWHDDHVEFVCTPLLKNGQRQATVQHAGCRKDNHGAWILNVRPEIVIILITIFSPIQFC
jgi:hypothetical protein